MARALFMVVVDVTAGAFRRTLLLFARWSGTSVRRTSRGWLPVLRWVVLVAIALLILPPLINFFLDLARDVGVWNRLEIERDPSVGQWWSPELVLLIAAAALALRWFMRARERVIIEEFVDYTTSDAKAVGGLAALLVTELSRLRELYGHVNDQLSTPMSVGVRERGGSEGSTEPGAFLSVRADEVTEVLSGAVASESKMTVGGITIPIGFVMSVLGRLARGPRVLGSVHLTEAGGGPTVTAQIVGRGGNLTWRVDAPEHDETTPAKAFLDPMVTEIACRMFTDMTLRGSVRWQAIRAFTVYLQLYWESLRTPKNRATYLKQAEGKLLEAVAEDETFDLAFYNLGVIYSQLAETETLAAESAEYPSRSAITPRDAHRARMAAARVAFRRAIELNPDRREAIYALAVHEFATVASRAWLPDEPLGDQDDPRLHCIEQRCARVLELDRWNAQALDLQGMTQLRLRDPKAARRSHQLAVSYSWWSLCRSEYTERRTPPTSHSGLPRARANASAALQNMAFAHWYLARDGAGLRKTLRMRRADWLFRPALDLAPTRSRAVMEFDRARLRVDDKRFEKAIESYRAALRIDRENPVYWAGLAVAQAHAGQVARGRASCDAALDALSPVFRRTLEPGVPDRDAALRANTLKCLSEAYTQLQDEPGRRRIADLDTLAAGILEAEADVRSPDADRLEAMLDALGDDQMWEREQVGLALARSLGVLDRWKEASERYEHLIYELEEHRRDGIRQHALWAKYAKTLRRQPRRKQEALTAAARGLVLNPISAIARREVGKAHFALLQYEEALEAWQHTLWLTPNDATLHWKTAFSHWSVAHDRHDWASRRAAFVQAADGFAQAAVLFGIENVAGWAWSRFWLGRTWSELGELDRAVTDLRAAKGCGDTALPARVLLGEVYLAAGESGLGNHQFARARAAVEEACARAQDRGAFLARNVDADWGETLTYREVYARILLGAAEDGITAQGSPAEAREHAERAFALADEIEHPRSQCLVKAHALELQSRLDFDGDDLSSALEKMQQAARLNPCPGMMLSELRLTEARVQNGAIGTLRAQLIAGMRERLQDLRSLEGDHGTSVEEAEHIVRRWTAGPVAASNGFGPVPS